MHAQAFAERCAGARDAAVREMGAVRAAAVDDPKSGAPRAGIDAQYAHARDDGKPRGRGRCDGSRRIECAPGSRSVSRHARMRCACIAAKPARIIAAIRGGVSPRGSESEAGRRSATGLGT